MARVILIGAVQFSEALARTLHAGPLDLVGVCTTSRTFGSDGLDLTPLADQLDVDVLDAVAEIGDQLEGRPGLLDQGGVDAVGDGGHQHVGLAHGGHQLGLGHGAVVDVEPGVEQLAHARLDRIGQLARDDDERLFSARHGFLESGSC